LRPNTRPGQPAHPAFAPAAARVGADDRDSFNLASFRQNRAQAAILSFAMSLDVILSMDFIYCLRHDFGGTKPSQKNPIKVDILAHAMPSAARTREHQDWTLRTSRTLSRRPTANSITYGFDELDMLVLAVEG